MLNYLVAAHIVNALKGCQASQAALQFRQQEQHLQRAAHEASSELIWR